MKKLTRFLRDWGILIQIVLIITWVLWALQLGGLFKEGFKEELAYQKTRDAGKEQRTMLELSALGFKLGDEAKALGKEYTPEKYFKDLRTLYEKAAEANMTPGPWSTGTILEQLRKNIGYSVAGQEAIEKASNEFVAWDEARNPREKSNITLASFKSWWVSLYFRTMLLLVISYITKMACRKGILETILAGKTKFIMSIILWPAFFYKYPYNIVREIRVEAELRRLGDLFRKLSPKELALVREVASSLNYRQWLNQTRRYNRGLVLALTITIIVNLLPSVARAQNASPTKETTVTVATCYEQIEDDVGENIEITMPAIIEEPQIMEPLILIAAIEEIELPWESMEPKDIDCIPETLLFVNSITKLLNQIAKGINHEDFNHYRGNRINPFNRNLCS